MSAVYPINKGINRPIEFRGLKAQYIGYLAGGLVGLLMAFAALYICGVNIYACLFLIGGLGTALFMNVFRLSKKYGQYGLAKRRAKGQLPAYLRCSSRRLFIHLKR
jgi:hypothetical protein